MRLAAQAKGGFYPTPPRVVDLIAGLIRVPAGYYHRNRESVRILDPCCGAGEAVAQLAQRLGGTNSLPIETYGVELHRDRAEEAGGRLDRAGGGPVPDLHRQRGLRPRSSSIPPMIGTRKTSGWSTHF